MFSKIFNRHDHSQRNNYQELASAKLTVMHNAVSGIASSLNDRERLEQQLNAVTELFSTAKRQSKQKLLNGGFVLKSRFDALETELDEARARLRDLSKKDLPAERLSNVVQRAEYLLSDISEKAKALLIAA